MKLAECKWMVINLYAMFWPIINWFIIMTQYSREDQTTKVTTEDGHLGCGWNLWKWVYNNDPYNNDSIPQNNNFNTSDDTHESLNYINKYRKFIFVISSLYNWLC